MVMGQQQPVMGQGMPMQQPQMVQQMPPQQPPGPEQGVGGLRPIQVEFCSILLLRSVSFFHEGIAAMGSKAHMAFFMMHSRART